MNDAAPADDAAHLLVVDDDRRLRKLLARFLSENGYRAVSYTHLDVYKRQHHEGSARHLLILGAPCTRT